MSLSYAPEDFKFFEHVKSFRLNKGKSKENRLTPLQVNIYGYIYGWCESGNICEVSMDEIAEYFSCSPTTIQNAIPRMEQLGWIKVVHGKRPEKSSKNVCNIYTIKRKPTAKKGLKPATKDDKKEKVVKTEAEIKKGKIYLCMKMMGELDIDFDEKKAIEAKLMLLAGL